MKIKSERSSFIKKKMDKNPYHTYIHVVYTRNVEKVFNNFFVVLFSFRSKINGIAKDEVLFGEF